MSKTRSNRAQSSLTYRPLLCRDKCPRPPYHSQPSCFCHSPKTAKKAPTTSLTGSLTLIPLFFRQRPNSSRALPWSSRLFCKSMIATFFTTLITRSRIPSSLLPKLDKRSSKQVRTRLCWTRSLVKYWRSYSSTFWTNLNRYPQIWPKKK